MFHKKINLFCAFASLLLLSVGCTHQLYLPNTVNTPLLKGKNDAELRISTLGATEAVLCYAPINHVVLQYSECAGKKTFSQYDPTTNGSKTHGFSQHYHELAGGAFKTFEGRRSLVTLSLMGGYGYGKNHQFYQVKSATVDFTFQKTFLQASVACRIPTFFALMFGDDRRIPNVKQRLGFGYRYQCLAFLHGVVSGQVPGEEVTAVQNVAMTSPYNFGEFSLYSGYDFKYLSLQGSLTGSASPNNLNFRKASIGIELTARIGELFELYRSHR